MAEILHIGGHDIDVRRRNKVLFPKAGITKGELLDYYRRIYPWMERHLRDRPLALQRWPDGIEGQSFFQKNAPDHFPDWIDRVAVKTDKGTTTHVVCNNEATIAFLAGQAVLTPHIFLSRAGHLERPDRLVLDFDPSGDDDFGLVRRGARAARVLLEALDMPAFVMTTGSRGLHVVVPLRADRDFDTVRPFARALAQRLADDDPEHFTTEMRKDKRAGRVFVDWLRNGYGQLAVCPFAVRGKPGAPVATPLDWHEVDESRLGPARYRVDNIFRRLARKDDPWAGMERAAVSVNADRRRRLERMGRHH